MGAFAQHVASFFADNFPSWRMLVIGGPAALIWAGACLAFAGYLKQRRRLRTGYTRKTFHFVIFGTVCAVNALWGTSGVCLFGAMTSLVVFYAVARGSGHFMYEALARESDAPRRTYYILVPYFATLVGGLIGNIYFPRAAVFGYLVCGLGDAVAEPVGVRFGKHKYRVPSLRGVKATRSIEGSCSILVVCVLALTACLAFSPAFGLNPTSFGIVLLIAVLSTFVEAVSPHGWDNTTMQVVPAMMASLLL